MKKRAKKTYETTEGRTIVGLVVRDDQGRETTEYMGEQVGRPILEPADVMREILGRFPAEIQDKREHFCALYLDTRRKLISAQVISTGTLDSSLVHPREVFGPAIRQSASAVVVFHNHPSGSPEPSTEDIALTRRLDKAAHLLGLSLLDHLIVCADGSSVSLRERQRSGRLPCDVFG